jgi:FAD/FMN-containing dehydrogenase
LKDFEYIPRHTVGAYTGRVARVSAGIETWELKNYMNKYGFTTGVPGGETVGAYGGWIAGGGHHSLSSVYGHGADSILSFQVVTPDGRYRSVTPDKNADLFFAMLGGGGGESGVATEPQMRNRHD